MDPETAPNQEKERKTNRSKRSVPGIILRIILVLLTGGVIGAVVYFSGVGWVPYLEQRIFEPIADNRDQLQEMAATQQALETQLSVLLKDQGEGFQDSDDNLEATLSAAKQELDRLEEELENVAAFSFTQVPALLATLTADQQNSAIHLSALATAQMESLGEGFETELFRILSLLSRATQYLLHDNYGLAEDQLEAALQVLQEIEEDLDDRQRLQALDLLNLIEGAMADLPNQPALAGGKIELAWQVALLGFQGQDVNELQVTPSPTGEEPITPAPTPND